MTPRTQFLMLVASYLAIRTGSQTTSWGGLQRAREIPPGFYFADALLIEQYAFDFVAWWTGWQNRPEWLPLNDREQAFEDARIKRPPQ